MKFISYAQNFEDVILNRAFLGQDRGFYIDVGAAHPTAHSVTKNFYERGWRGVNIEPGSAIFGLIEAERTRDINLNLGLSDKVGSLTFFEAPNSIGLSTFVEQWSQDWNRRDGCEFVERTVPVMTLAAVCEKYVDGPIDFLKVDVEGHERAVLDGGDFKKWRPKVVVAEGDKAIWEQPLLDANYLYATYDGVNYYFVREEDRDLVPKLAKPVSLVADNFELFEHLLAVRDLSWLMDQEKGRHEATRRELEAASAERDQLKAALAKWRQELAHLAA